MEFRIKKNRVGGGGNGGTPNSKFQIPNSVEDGFTLIELVVSIGIIIFLVASTVFILDPASQIARSRNNQREAHVQLILNAVGQNIFDNKGNFACASGEVPTTTKRMATSTGNYNIGPCLIPTYLQNLPIDPSTSGVKYINENDYDTGYYIIRNATTGRVTISAPAAELGKSVTATR